MKEIQAGWCLIPPHIISRDDLSPNEKFLYGRILGLLGVRGYCFASNAWLGKQLGISKKTVANILTSLKEKQLITTEVVYGDNKKIIERRIFVLIIPQSGIPIPAIGNTPIPAIGKDSIRDISVDISNGKSTAFDKEEDLSDLLPSEKKRRKEEKKTFGFGIPARPPAPQYPRYERKRRTVADGRGVK
jgi:DNA-binding Lrp family transcriptional regulator